jgi:hypothetical protein
VTGKTRERTIVQPLDWSEEFVLINFCSMPLFSKVFKLQKSQSELDFVDIPLHTDIWLFVDPFAISQRVDVLSQASHQTILAFFQNVVDSIRSGQIAKARRLLIFLREPNETHLGLSRKKSKGAGVGPFQARQIFNALQQSSAVRTGFLNSLEECELMIEGLGRDKMSDLTTNIIRRHLVSYTQEQCHLHNVPMVEVPIPPSFNAETMTWESQYAPLPVWRDQQILLVPKVFVRATPAYDHQQYYRHFVLKYLQAEALSAGSSLIHALKNGKRVVYKRDLEKEFPCTKEFLYRFSLEHPDVLQDYKDHLTELERRGAATAVLDTDEPGIASALITALKSISSGNADASQYHALMIGVLEFLLFPQLIAPKKEREIHEGRKRIDILMENGARGGIFDRLHSIRHIPCSFVPIECKNYSRDIANPELDQISGRFSPVLGKVGLICCRTFEDRELFIQRCRDTFHDDRGLIVPVDDERITQLLNLIVTGQRRRIDAQFNEWIDEVFL